MFIAERSAMPLDLLEQGAAGGGWDAIDQLLLPQEMTQAFKPQERVAMFLYALSTTPDGREVIEWLLDITRRVPLRITGSSIEETALRAAQLQGIHGVGESILAALIQGKTLADKSKPQNGAGK